MLLTPGRHSHTGVLWVSGQGAGTSLPQKLRAREGGREGARERREREERDKHWQQLGTLDLSAGETPSPACTLLPARTRILWGAEMTWELEGPRREDSLQMGEGKENNRANFPIRV